jgi:hypothetical protein
MQSSELAGTIACEQQAVLALVHEQWQIAVPRRVSSVLKYIVNVAKGESEEWEAVVLHALWGDVFVDHVARQQG